MKGFVQDIEGLTSRDVEFRRVLNSLMSPRSSPSLL
jgi:hypothetical protein